MLKPPRVYCYRSIKHHLIQSSEVMTRWPENSQFSTTISTSISQPSITSLMIFDMQTPDIIYASHAKYQPIVSTCCRYRSEKVPKQGEKTDHLLITSRQVIGSCLTSRTSVIHRQDKYTCKVSRSFIGSIRKSPFFDWCAKGYSTTREN